MDIFNANSLPSLKVHWSVYKGLTDVKENFKNGAQVWCFLTINNMEIFCPVESLEDGSVTFGLPIGLKAGVYGVKMIWVKDGIMKATLTGEMAGYKRCISEVENVFAITNDSDDVTSSESSLIIELKSHAATYGYDGVSAYEKCVMTGRTTLSESQWLDMMNGSVRVEVIASGTNQGKGKMTDANGNTWLLEKYVDSVKCGLPTIEVEDITKQYTDSEGSVYQELSDKSEAVYEITITGANSTDRLFYQVKPATENANDEDWQEYDADAKPIVTEDSDGANMIVYAYASKNVDGLDSDVAESEVFKVVDAVAKTEWLALSVDNFSYQNISNEGGESNASLTFKYTIKETHTDSESNTQYQRNSVSTDQYSVAYTSESDKYTLNSQTGKVNTSTKAKSGSVQTLGQVKVTITSHGLTKEATANVKQNAAIVDAISNMTFGVSETTPKTVTLQGSGDIAIAKVESNNTSFIVSYNGQVITVTPASSNTGASRSATITVTTVGGLTKTFTATQGAAGLDAISNMTFEAGSTTGKTATVSGTGNVTIASVTSSNENAFTVSYSGQAITVTPTGANSGSSRSSTITVTTVGGLTKTFTATQGAASLNAISNMEFEADSTTGSEVTVSGTGNVTIASVTSSNENSFTVSYSGQVITVTPFGANLGSEKSATITVTTVGGLTKTFTATQKAAPDKMIKGTRLLTDSEAESLKSVTAYTDLIKDIPFSQSELVDITSSEFIIQTSGQCILYVLLSKENKKAQWYDSSTNSWIDFTSGEEGMSGELVFVKVNSDPRGMYAYCQYIPGVFDIKLRIIDKD